MADQLISVTLTGDQWQVVSDLVGEYSQSLSSDWIKWGQQIQQTIQTSIYKSRSTSTPKADVLLDRNNWLSVKDAITKVSPKKGREWITWANNICQWIQQSLDGVSITTSGILSSNSTTPLQSQFNTNQSNTSNAVNAIHLYAAELMKSGLSNSQTESKLIEQGIDRNLASIVVNNVLQIKAKASKDAGKKNMIWGAIWCIGGLW